MTEIAFNRADRPSPMWHLRPVIVGSALAGAVATVLRRMEREYDTTDDLRPSTVVAMYATYAAGAAALAWSARRRVGPAPLPRRPAGTTGAALAALGAVVATAGASKFQSPSQLSGTEAGQLHTDAIYRYTRNPQYLGLGLVVSGIAIGSRSTFAGLLAAGTWATYRRWIPSEECHLERTFGDAYRQYSRRVNRWLGRTSIH